MLTHLKDSYPRTRDVSLPEFYLKSKPEYSLGQWSDGPPSDRTILAFSAGAPHGEVRKHLFEYWVGKDIEVVVYEYERLVPKGKNYHKMMSETKFC